MDKGLSHIHFSLFEEKKTIEARDLFKYISLVRDLAFQRKQWQFYDSQFRRTKSSTQRSWADIDWELFFRGGSSLSAPSRPIPQRASQIQQRKIFGKPGVPYGHCFDFHYVFKKKLRQQSHMFQVQQI